MVFSADDYADLIESLESLCEKCESIVELDKGSIQDLTLGTIQSTIAEARKLLSWQDQFLKAGLYHIIGSDGLSAVQLNKVVYLAKRLGNTRTSVKRFASIDNSIYTFNLSVKQDSQYSFNIGDRKFSLKK